jgi:arylsulfatase A-like enzyme
MASEGIRFEQFYTASPICSPSRTGFLTGMFPARWRITSYLQTRAGNAGCEQADFLDPRAPSLARVLKASGYTTAHIGKWHMGGGRDVVDPPGFPAYGFDEHASTWESPDPHPDLTGGDFVWSPNDRVPRWERTAWMVDRTLEFLDRRKDRPCFVNLWPDDVHLPFIPDEASLPPRPAPNAAAKAKNKDAAKAKNKAVALDTLERYRAVMKEYDRQIGRLLDGLRSRGIAEHTLVIFTSDNGAWPTYDGARSGGFRGSKLSLYEEGIRMPFRSIPRIEVDPSG